MTRCEGAGREHRQADSLAGQGKYSSPPTSCSVYKRGLSGRQESSLFWDFSAISLFVQEFELFWEFGLFFLRVPQFIRIHFNSWNPWDLCSAIAAWGLAMQVVTWSWEKNCIVYCLFCVFSSSSSNSSSSSSSSSIILCCFIKLSLSQPTSFTWCPFSSPSHCGGEGDVWASGCLVFNCRLSG